MMSVDMSGLLNEYTAALVRIVVNRVRSRARELVPRDTGDLRDSITAVTGGGQGQVLVTSEYALSVEFGAKAHMIPNAFGRGVAVMHPGQAPQPFLAPAIRYVKKTMGSEYLLEFKRVAVARGLPAEGKTVVHGKSALPLWRR